MTTKEKIKVLIKMRRYIIYYESGSCGFCAASLNTQGGFRLKILGLFRKDCRGKYVRPESWYWYTTDKNGKKARIDHINRVIKKWRNTK